MGKSFSSDIMDQTFLFDQPPQAQQNFMPSPPYTPYSHNTPSSHFNSNGMVEDSPQYSHPSPPYSKGTPSPQNFCDDNLLGFSNSTTSTTSTPAYDHMTPSSTPSHPPVPPSQFFVNQQTAPIASQGTTVVGPPREGMFGGNRRVVTTNSHVTTYGSQSSTPSPSLELRATFVPNGNATSSLSGYSEAYSVPVGPDMTNMLGLSEAELVQKSIPSLTQAPPHIRQTIVHNTRQRYAGPIPTGHTPSSSGGVVGGHMTVGRGGDVESASDSISQWSQWLKGSAPAPVC